MKRVRTSIDIVYVDVQENDGPITWAKFKDAINGLEIRDTDIISVGPDFTYYDGEKDLNGYSISILRNIYETDEEETERIKADISRKLAYQKTLADRALEQHKKAVEEHERLAALFNPLPKAKFEGK